MIFRSATTDDTANLREFIITAWKEAGPGALGFTGATDKVMHEITSESFIRTLLANPETHLFIAESEGGIIGFSSLKPVGPDEAELSGLIVLERARGRGIGTGLLEKAMDVAMEEGFRRVEVKTEALNLQAIAFYKIQGFHEKGRVKENVEGTEVDLMVLEKNLLRASD
jgi:ribosomal protein S18 acetylase RimI-like enzyme